MSFSQIINYFISPLSDFYCSLSFIERKFFEIFYFLVEQPSAVVVSVGNLSLGGTGKTPILLELLADPERPIETVVLTRGYKSAWEYNLYLLRGKGPHPGLFYEEKTRFWQNSRFNPSVHNRELENSHQFCYQKCPLGDLFNSQNDSKTFSCADISCFDTDFRRDKLISIFKIFAKTATSLFATNELASFLLDLSPSRRSAITDEALQINSAFPDVPVLIGKNRAHAAVMAEKWFSPRLILLDDGFQYRRIRHDVDIVLWDATMDPTLARPLPLGRLRESPSRLADADVLMLTRCETANKANISYWKQFLYKYGKGVPILKVFTLPTAWIDRAGNIIPLEEGPKNVYAFAAIANPRAFFNLLEKIGCRVCETTTFADHHVFTAQELAKVQYLSKKQRAVPVCTDKDRIKISAEIADQLNLWTLITRPFVEKESLDLTAFCSNLSHLSNASNLSSRLSVSEVTTTKIVKQMNETVSHESRLFRSDVTQLQPRLLQTIIADNQLSGSLETIPSALRRLGVLP